MGLPIDFILLNDPTLSTDLTLPDSALAERFRYSSKELGELLQLWLDCPTRIRSSLSPGIVKFAELSSEAAKYAAIRYPLFFFQLICNAAILKLRRGETVDDECQAILLTAWDASQVSIDLANNHEMSDKMYSILTKTTADITNLLESFWEYENEQNVKPQEWKLKLKIQRLCCHGVLETLLMFCHPCSKETLASSLRDLDEEIHSVAEQYLDLRRAANSESIG